MSHWKSMGVWHHDYIGDNFLILSTSWTKLTKLLKLNVVILQQLFTGLQRNSLMSYWLRNTSIENLQECYCEADIWVKIHLLAHFQKSLWDKPLGQIDQSCKVQRQITSLIFSSIFILIKINLTRFKLNMN